MHRRTVGWPVTRSANPHHLLAQMAGGAAQYAHRDPPPRRRALTAAMRQQLLGQPRRALAASSGPLTASHNQHRPPRLHEARSYAAEPGSPPGESARPVSPRYDPGLHAERFGDIGDAPGGRRAFDACRWACYRKAARPHPTPLVDLDGLLATGRRRVSTDDPGALDQRCLAVSWGVPHRPGRAQQRAFTRARVSVAASGPPEDLEIRPR